MNFSVLGCGRWGSFIAWYLNKIGENVTVWGRADSDITKSLFETKKNEYVEMPETIKMTTYCADGISAPVNNHSQMQFSQANILAGFAYISSGCLQKFFSVCHSYSPFLLRLYSLYHAVYLNHRRLHICADTESVCACESRDFG